MLRAIPTAAFLVLILLAGTSGCDGGKDNAPGGASGSTGSTGGSPAEVRLGYFPNLTHAQAVLGVASGEYEKAVAPSRLQTKTFNAGPSLIEAIFAGEIDVGYIGPQPALTGHDRSKGKGIRVVSGAAANGVLIVARKDSGINTLEDLAGKRVASPQQGNTQDIAAQHYLTAELGQPDAKNVIAVPNAEQQGRMENGDIDASWAPEPWGSFLVSQAGAKVIAQEKDLWQQGQFATVVVITTPEFLSEHPETVRKLLWAHRMWTKRLQEEPDKYVPELESALFDLTKKKLPAGVLRSAFGNTQFTDDPMPYTFDKFARWSYDLGFTKAPTDTAGLIDTTILDKLKAADAAETRPAETEPAGATRKSAEGSE